MGVQNIEAVNCTFCGADAVLDLHRPSCAARVAGYVFGGLCRRDDVGEVRLENGDDILRAVGYKGFEHPRVAEEKEVRCAEIFCEKILLTKLWRILLC